MKTSLLNAALSCVLAALPVAAAEATSPPVPPPIAPAVGAQMSQGMADLGLAFLRDQAASQNSMNSPYGVTNALGMVLLGAVGDSELQLARVLQGGSTAPGLLARYIEEINPALASISAHATFRNANRMWLNAALTQSIVPIYTQMVRMSYQSDAVLQSFDNPDLAVPTINAWIRQQTLGKIEAMLVTEQLHSSTQMVLVNAVYFKGLWRTPFPKERTAAAAFTLADGKTIRVPTMHALVNARSAQQGGARWLELPYGPEAAASDWVMQIALPPRGQSLAQFQQQLTGAQWQDATAQLKAERLDLALPRFSMKGATGSLRASLMKLGVVDIFTEKANLIGISAAKNLFVDDVLHRATIDVDETGTVAAAATAVVLGTRSAPMVPRLEVDRPFLFFIVHRPTQTPVFVGRVMNPASGI